MAKNEAHLGLTVSIGDCSISSDITIIIVTPLNLIQL